MELLQYEFFRNALIAVVILSVASAMIGTYIIARRLVAISGGVTHACFGGLGLGYFLGINPIVTAALFAVGSSVGVEWMSTRYRVREDSAIAVIWAIGMAIGVIFVFLTPGYVPELNSFLFGNILTITRADLLAFGVFTAVLIGFFAIYFKQIVACAFDSDYAAVAGLKVRFINYAMTVLVAVCIVLTIRLVGIMLLMSLFSLPQMTAEIFTHRFRGMMIGSVIVSAVCCVAGLLLSTLSDVPCSAIIVAIMAGAFFAGRILKPLFSR
ncbi:MAG: metal ABC transporter permease [Bacteroidales bacterium]|nr:metal ABC transporter permease [Bacteroidales bacterium]MDE6801648.1 metal ABC transporter permease [Muribaculaceae bacterium]MDE6831741.1 metal ABC transporter permease [Muribaculaceae bacterium]